MRSSGGGEDRGRTETPTGAIKRQTLASQSVSLTVKQWGLEGLQEVILVILGVE